MRVLSSERVGVGVAESWTPHPRHWQRSPSRLWVPHQLFPGPLPLPMEASPGESTRPMGFGGGRGLVSKLCPTLATPWTVAHQAPLSMGFTRQEHWSGFPCPPPGDLPDPGIKPGSPAFQAVGEVAILSRNTEEGPSPHGLFYGKFSWHLKWLHTYCALCIS